MSSRELARVVIQLLGLVVFIYILVTAHSVIHMSGAWRHFGPIEAVVWIGVPVFMLGIAYVFVRYAERLAAWLRIGAHVPQESIRIDRTWTPDAAVRVGCVVVGLFVGLQTIDPIAFYVGAWLGFDTERGFVSARPPSDVVGVVLRLVLALLLLAGPGRVIRWIRSTFLPPSVDRSGPTS